MAWRLANSLTRLRDQVNSAYPNRNKASDGTIGDAAHAGSASDHNPNAQGVVCALDLTNDPGVGFNAHAVADNLRINRHPNLKYIISNGRICGAWTGWNWWAYNGSNPHSRHIHVSVGVGSDGRSQPPYDDTTNWAIGGGSAPAPAPTPPPVNAVKGSVRVTVPILNVRSAPNTGAPLSGDRQLTQGTVVGYTAVVGGQNVSGNAVWLRSVRGNFFWSGGTSYVQPVPQGGTAQAVRTTNVRIAPTTGAALGGSRQLQAGQTFRFTAIVTGQNVSQNGVTTNKWLRSEFGNYVWAGNCKW